MSCSLDQLTLFTNSVARGAAKTAAGGMIYDSFQHSSRVCGLLTQFWFSHRSTVMRVRIENTQVASGHYHCVGRGPASKKPFHRTRDNKIWELNIPMGRSPTKYQGISDLSGATERENMSAKEGSKPHPDAADSTVCKYRSS
mgnify:CR=1 FL=1